ncbi:amidohydrolase family protein [Bittarella massiliensis (ex Durand et al. 2017)]|uniref:amidohydrolase family protein n=1 Tax=Bittarella massiliensis (ex Durand et al. 2017) TaxID=1720313 RepID=UPI00073E29F0|nr:amidohydrolase family protein [Bittarella massiliensis (ex Durand et al. 2017)]
MDRGTLLIKNCKLARFDDLTAADADIRIADGKIAAIGPLTPGEGETVLEAGGMLCMPAFVDTHTHLVQSLQKGHMDGLAITNWLVKMLTTEQILSEEEYFYGTLLGLLQGLRFGVTTFHDMIQYPWVDAAAEAYNRAGLRVVMGLGATDVAENEKTYMVGLDNSLRQAEDIYTRFHNTNGGLIRTDVAPLGLPACSKELMQALKAFSRERGLTFHTHLAEGRMETEQIRARTGWGEGEALYRYGILDEKTILAHSIWLEERELDMIAESGATVAHCPCTNMKISDGIPPIDRMAAKGVHLALGCDGEASSSNRDMVREMHAGALLQKVVTGRPQALPESLCYRMMTENGARALGFDDLGRVAVGNRADLILVDMQEVSLVGEETQLSNFLHAGTGFQVDTVLVEGAVRLRGKQFVDIDAEAIMARCERVIRGIYERQ